MRQAGRAILNQLAIASKDQKKPNMHWLTTGIETNAAYGTCILLFGLLVLSVRHRKNADRIPSTFYPVPLNGKARPALKYRPGQKPKRVSKPFQNSSVLLGTGLISAPREQANPKSAPSVAKKLSWPPEVPGAKKSNEVQMDTFTFPFENLDAVGLAGIGTVAEAESPVQDRLALPAAVYGHFEIDEHNAEEIAIAPDLQPAVPVDSETPAVIEASGPEINATPEISIEAQQAVVESAPLKTAAENLLSFFGLRQQPFDVTPDPAYLYLSPSHREALVSLKQGIEHFRGFMMLVAEPGMGKTTILNKLMEELSDSARVVFLFQTQCTSRELLCFILNELEVDHTGMDVVAMHRALNQALLEEMLRGRRFVLIVDEAQNLQEPVLETIRLLSDFETTHSKLIQIVLAGQPQIAETLMRDSLVQLRQRIAVLSNLSALNAAETAQYVGCRLLAAGWSGNSIFTDEALGLIAESSAGVPRGINNLCFNAMLAAFDRGLEVIDANLVAEVSGKLNLQSLVRRARLEPVSPEPAAQPDPAVAAQLAHALAAALAAEANLEAHSETVPASTVKPGTALTGTLTEKVRSQGWSKHHEYRILVTLERDRVSGIPIADRYYCASLYMDEKQAAELQVGKPVRIKIEQE